MITIGHILLFILNVYFWIIIATVVISWLIAFDVLNVRNAQARNIVGFLNKLTEPVYKPLRIYIPSLGGIDVTPIIVIFTIYILQNLIVRSFIY
jgi:YggT family protein